MRIEFSERTKRDNVVFEIVAETDAEVALLSLLYSGPRWLEMESLSKVGNTFARVWVSQNKKDAQ
jgi:hypothetical protein